MKNMHKKNKGSALLMALGVLSLLLILAMSFSFTARTNRQSSAINADQVKARLGSESALGWVLTSMRINVEKRNTNVPYFFKKTPFNLIWYDKNSPFKNRTTLLDSEIEQGMFISRVKRPYEGDEEEDLKKALNVGSHLPIVAKMLDDESKTNIVELFPEYSGYYSNFRLLSNSNGYVTRTAYLVLEDSNKLDVNQALTLSKASDKRPFVKGDGTSYEDKLARTGSISTNDFAYNIAGYDNSDNPKTSITESNTLRLGLNMQELRLDSDFFNNLQDGANFRVPWLSYYHLAKKSGHYSGIDLFKYTFFSGDDIEAYWDDTNKTERQRFDVTGAEWAPDTDNGWQDPGTISTVSFNKQYYLDKTNPYANELIDALCGDSQRELFYSDYSTQELEDSPGFSGGTPDENFGIPHLNSLGATGRQIAANMVDFCDQDSYATLPKFTIDPGDNIKNYLLRIEDDIEFCGNEKVPYFNEFSFSLTGWRSMPTYIDPDDPENPDKMLYTFYLGNPEINLEMLQIYLLQKNEHARAIPGGKCAVRIYVNSIKYQVDENAEQDFVDYLVNASILKKDEPSDPASIPYFELIFNYDDIWCRTNEDVEKSVKYVLPTLETTIPSSWAVNADAKKVKYSWTISRISMVSYYENSDTICVFDSGFWKGTASGDTTITGEVPVSGIRMTASWEVADPRLNHKSSSWNYRPFAEGTVGSLNARNTFATPSDCDLEKYDELFVATEGDKTFSTAFIPNRPFENLWEVGAIHRGQPFRTIDLLEEDKVLADQLKIGPLKVHQGTYNINARNLIALAEFAKGINITDGYEDVDFDETNDATFTKTSSELIPAALKSVTWEPTFNRSDRVDIFKKFNEQLPTNKQPVNDREREAFFARTIPLLTTRNERFSIVIASQLLKQIDGADSSNWDDIKGTLLNPTRYSVPEGATSTLHYYSIQTTHRIVAHVVMDAWRNQFKVVQLRYLED